MKRLTAIEECRRMKYDITLEEINKFISLIDIDSISLEEFHHVFHHLFNTDRFE